MSLDAAERAALAELADALIPAGDGMPSASAAGVAGQWLDAVLAAAPAFAAGLKAVVRRVEGRAPGEFIAVLAREDPSAFTILAEVVTNAYFMNPEVRRAIGYDGQGPRPLDLRADYMEDGLLESVIRRGPIYRPTPRQRGEP